MRLSPLRHLCLESLEDRHLLATVLSESFETDGQNVRYIASQPFNDQSADFWGRGSNAQFIGAADYLNPDGSSFWAAKDTNAPEGDGNAVQSILFGNLEVLEYENLRFSGRFAASDRFGGFPRDDRILVQYRVDGGSFQDALRFSPTGINRPLALDTDFDGAGDGPLLTRDFASSTDPFSFNIPNGTTLDVLIEVKADGANEEVAFDSIQVLGDLIPDGQAFGESFETDGQGSRYTASMPFNDQAADFWDRGQNSDFVGASHDYLNPDGAYFWAARDTNAADGNGNTVQTIDFANIDISAFENLQFSGRFAASERFGGSPPDDRILVQYRVDGGTFQDGLRFSPARINGPLAVDAKFDGLGEGTPLTHDFAGTSDPFTFEIPEGN